MAGRRPIPGPAGPPPAAPRPNPPARAFQRRAPAARRPPPCPGWACARRRASSARPCASREVAGSRARRSIVAAQLHRSDDLREAWRSGALLRLGRRRRAGLLGLWRLLRLVHYVGERGQLVLVGHLALDLRGKSRLIPQPERGEGTRGPLPGGAR